MSEQDQSFMQALDAWMDVNVIGPLVYQSEDEDGSESDGEETIAMVKKAIKGKVLQSYRNGVAVGARQAGAGERSGFSRSRSGPRDPVREAAAQGQRQRRPMFQR